MIKTNASHLKVCYWKVYNKNTSHRTVCMASLAVALYIFSVQSNIVDNFIPVFLISLMKWSFWYKPFEVQCREREVWG